MLSSVFKLCFEEDLICGVNGEAQRGENLLVIPAWGTILPLRASRYLGLIPLWTDWVESPEQVRGPLLLVFTYKLPGPGRQSAEGGGEGRKERKENFSKLNGLPSKNKSAQ